MSKLACLLLLGLGAGLLGTITGSSIALAIPKPKKSVVGFMLGISIGVMISLVFFELLPEALVFGIIPTAVCFIFGIAITSLLSRLVSSKNNQSFGLMTTIGIAIHNFPEGLAIGASFFTDIRMSLSVALLIGLHDIPEGVACAASLKADGGRKNSKILLLSALSGLPTTLATVIGGMIGNISKGFIGSSMAFAAGAMFFITMYDLAPKAYMMQRKENMILSAVIGVLLGILICFHSG